MEPKEYKLFDLHRILFGEVPYVFLIEVVIRTVFIYILLIVSIRMMGKRMALQLNVTEMTAMVALAAAIGVPIQAPDRGLLPAVVIAIVVVISERMISTIAKNNQGFEKIVHGDLNVLVSDSVVNFECLKLTSLSRELLFEQIRAAGCDHLGKVKRVYMESSGAFSLVKEEEGKPGLSVIPHHDHDYWVDIERSSDYSVCSNCGTLRDDRIAKYNECPGCGHQHWQKAVL